MGRGDQSPVTISSLNCLGVEWWYWLTIFYFFSNLIFKFIFNWRIIALQCCCFLLNNRTNQLQVYTCPLPLEPLFPHRIPPLSHHRTQSLELNSLSYTAASLPVYFTRDGICMSVQLSIHPTLSFFHCVHNYTFYICVSISALQVGSSVPFF